MQPEPRSIAKEQKYLRTFYYNYLNYLNEACYYYHNVFKKLPFLSFIDETIASPIQLESKHPTILFLPRKWATRE